MNIGEPRRTIYIEPIEEPTRLRSNRCCPRPPQSPRTPDHVQRTRAGSLERCRPGVPSSRRYRTDRWVPRVVLHPDRVSTAPVSPQLSRGWGRIQPRDGAESGWVVASCGVGSRCSRSRAGLGVHMRLLRHEEPVNTGLGALPPHGSLPPSGRRTAG